MILIALGNLILGVIASGWFYADILRGDAKSTQPGNFFLSLMLLITGGLGFGVMILIRLVHGEAYGWRLPRPGKLPQGKLPQGKLLWFRTKPKVKKYKKGEPHTHQWATIMSDLDTFRICTVCKKVQTKTFQGWRDLNGEEQ